MSTKTNNKTLTVPSHSQYLNITPSIAFRNPTLNTFYKPQSPSKCAITYASYTPASILVGLGKSDLATSNAHLKMGTASMSVS
jgi:hypothetical protein